MAPPPKNDQSAADLSGRTNPRPDWEMCPPHIEGGPAPGETTNQLRSSQDGPICARTGRCARLLRAGFGDATVDAPPLARDRTRSRWERSWSSARRLRLLLFPALATGALPGKSKSPGGRRRGSDGTSSGGGSDTTLKPVCWALRVAHPGFNGWKGASRRLDGAGVVGASWS